MVSNTQTITLNNYENKVMDTNEYNKSNNNDQTKLKELKLKQNKKVHWTEDTIDNEGMGKKKSKICCIYHKPRLNPDDTSSDESCSSCDEKGKNAYERPNHYEKHHKNSINNIVKK